VVSVFDVIEDDDTDYIVMEYVDGTTMRARIADGPPLTLNQVLHLGRRIAAGMAKAHELGIVHRDLKTENVLISRTGDVKIADFGIAKVPGEDSLTEEGTVVGTYKAMSPEQALGADVDYRTDLFSFGVLLYEAFAGVPPFTGRNSEEIRGAVLRSDPPPLIERRPDLPQALLNLIGQLLHKARDLRPAGGFPAVQAALSELGTNGPDEIFVEEARSPGHDDETLSVEQPESHPAQTDTSAPSHEATAAPDAPGQKATTRPAPIEASASFSLSSSWGRSWQGSRLPGGNGGARRDDPCRSISPWTLQSHRAVRTRTDNKWRPCNTRSRARSWSSKG
jgi:serine/threonine protein kinase